RLAQVSGVRHECSHEPLDLIAVEAVHDPEMVDNHLRPSNEPLVFRRSDHSIKLFSVATHEDHSTQIATVRLEKHRFEAFDVPLALLPAQIAQQFAEYLSRGLFAPAHRETETNENAEVRHS